MSYSIKRSAYADMFGPTTGDRVRLADTDLGNTSAFVISGSYEY